MTSNEQLIKLYHSTTDIKLKDKKYREIYNKNIGLIKDKIKFKLSQNNGLKIDMCDLYQEASIAIHIAINTYNETKSAFHTYFSQLILNRIDNYLRREIYPYSTNEIHIDFSREDVHFDSNSCMSSSILDKLLIDANPEIELDNEIIRDNINICINKLKFKEDWHEIVFRYRYGLNKEKITVRERELAEIFDVTQQRIAFVCKNYKDKLKIILLEHIKSGEAEDFGLDNRKRG